MHAKIKGKLSRFATMCTDAGYDNADGGTLLAPMDIEIDVDYNALILRPQFDGEFLGTEWFNQEPWFVNGGPGRVVIHTGGRGVIRVTVVGTDNVAPPSTDSLLDEWEDIGEA
ncbi:DUF4962 domain-containing protein [Rhodococcus opacus]|uniref:DUF4962 domain-containing protein n=1 Tax=Rhodococcus opacus TaxID=37919 RepID=UPI001C45556F|nr:DUF4962 domain-containing protein [Rhodococcus opacus]MBV6756868.1 DUF4962 domain-containing protein [Rhodococcus opacus]